MGIFGWSVLDLKMKWFARESDFLLFCVKHFPRWKHFLQICGKKIPTQVVETAFLQSCTRWRNIFHPEKCFSVPENCNWKMFRGKWNHCGNKIPWKLTGTDMLRGVGCVLLSPFSECAWWLPVRRLESIISLVCLLFSSFHILLKVENLLWGLASLVQVKLRDHCFFFFFPFYKNRYGL